MEYPAMDSKTVFAGLAGKILTVALCILPVVANARDWPGTVGEGSISRWYGDRVAAFSLTIDDNHVGDLPFWLSMGNDYDMNWTWFLITGNVGISGGTWAQWQSAVDQGHAMGSHSVTHFAAGDPLTPTQVTNEYANSQIALEANLTSNHALALGYPYGNVAPNDPAIAEVYYIAARGVVGGVNTGNSINYMDTHSISMSSSSLPLFVNPGAWMYYGHLLDSEHSYYEGWYSVHFHSVSGLESGVTNMMDALDASEADIWVGTFQQVAQYGQERENATLTVTSVSGSEIRFTVTDTLDDTLFYYPLTVKIRVDNSWDAATAVQGGASVPVELVEHEGNKYALVQAVPDQGETTLEKAGVEGLLVVLRGLSHNRVWVDGDFVGPVFTGEYEKPYQTVQAGLDAAAAGDIITVREGTYREQITLPSGTASQPVTLSAASGERVVLNAMTPLTDWQPMTAGLYSKVVAWEPSALFSGFQKMVLAREPNEGWWEVGSVSDNGGTFTITDAANLTGFPHDLTDASVYIWTQTDDRFYTCPIVSVDTVSGSVEFENVNPAMAPATGDKYWLQNQVSLIDLSNEWAAEPEGGNFRIYYFPADTVDLAGTQIPPASGWVVSGLNAAHVRMDNLEVVGGANGGIYLNNSQDVEINRCIVHNNVQHGIWMNLAQDCAVRNSIMLNNRFGLGCANTTGLLVEGNEIGPNSEDGLVFSWNSANLTVRRNYIHDHMLWGHPDNAQTYRGVSGLDFIENLIMSGGQSVMLEETTDVEFSGNMVIGSAANMLNFGHGTVTNVVVHGNTLACSGYSSLGLTGETTYDVKDNIFMTGHGSQICAVTDAMDYQGDYNLFWNSDGLVDPVLLVSDGAWGSTPGPMEAFSIVYENDNVVAGETSTTADSVHANVAAGALSFPATFPTGDWPDALTAKPNNAAINSLDAAISGGDFFTFTVTPDAGALCSYSNLFVRYSIGANARPAATEFTLMSSLTGFTASDGIDTISASLPSAASTTGTGTFDLSGASALQNVPVGTTVEFRIYAHNTGANSMTRIGIGHIFATNGDDDLRLEGGVAIGGGGGGTPETIYHTNLPSFQTTTGLELNSTNSDPLFVNAPLGINVMDSALLHQATLDTFALRDANRFTVGDHVEVNFDGVERTVTASSGAIITVDPALDAKPLKGWLIANWGASTNFSLDLGLQPGSPGIGLGQGGGTVGSPVSVQQFQNGDFDGDGKRDLPVIPADIVQ